MKIKNALRIERRLEKASSALPTVNKLIGLLKQHGIEPDTPDFAGVLRYGGLRYFQMCQEERKKIIPGLSDVPQNYKELTEIHGELAQAIIPAEVEITDITVKDGSAALTDAFIQKVIDSYTYQIEDPSELKFWQKLTAFAKAFNQLEDAAEKLNRDSMTDFLNSNSNGYFLIYQSGESKYSRLEPNPDVFMK